MKIKKNNDSMYKQKNKKNVDLLLIEEGKRHSVIIKDFNTFMYVHIFHHGKKTFLLLLSESNMIQTHNHLVHKGILNHLARLAK